jgi:hypothetical protein
MILTIVMQVAVLPLTLSFLVMLAAIKFQQLRSYVPIALILAWIASYVWILDWPNMPPRVVQDWFWVIAISASLLAMFWKNGLVMTCLALSALGITLWPVLSTQMTGLLAVELIVLVACVYPIVKSTERKHSSYDYFTLCFLIGSLGVLTIASGSSLIGFLSIALAFAHGAAALLGFKIAWQIDSRALSVLCLVLISSVRVYVELPLIASAALLLALLLLRRGHVLSQLSRSLISAVSVSAAIAVVAFIELQAASATAYY